MAIQHKDIPDGNIHEPKGISTAPLNTVYVASGTGTGVYKKVNTSMLEGAGTPAAGRRILTSGVEGITTVTNFALGSMQIVNNLNSFAIGAASDPTLASSGDYLLFSGNGAPWQVNPATENASFNGNGITVNVTGVWAINCWLDIRSYPSNAAVLAVKYRINGTTFQTGRSQSKASSTNGAANLVFFDHVQLTAGDTLQLYLASTVAGGIIIGSADFTVRLEKGTT